MVFSARGGQNLKLCQVSELIVIWAEIGLVVAASDSAFVVVFFSFRRVNAESCLSFCCIFELPEKWTLTHGQAGQLHSSVLGMGMRQTATNVQLYIRQLAVTNDNCQLYQLQRRQRQ